MPYADPTQERERQAKRNRLQHLEVANVSLPARKNQELYDACRLDLHMFLQEAFPSSTGMRPFGDGQKQAIGLIQHAILHGGRVAQAFPRGFAKTSISARAAIWGVLYGHRSYIPVFGASEDNATIIIDSIKTELAENPILIDMFPALECVHSLEGKAQRCYTQHINGELTHMRWRGDRVVLPTVAGFEGSGGILQAKSMRGARGMQHTTPDGTIHRPDFVILDDVQSDEDARSPATVDKIVNKIKKAILRGGGHSTTLAAVLNATVIEADDVAERFLADPGWQSVRYKMVTSFPKRMDLWEGEYHRLIADYSGDDPASQLDAKKRALQFYVDNREAMDEGGEVAWEWAYAWDDEDPVELSALQHAMNIKLVEGEDVFATECQNEPHRLSDEMMVTPVAIMEKTMKHQGAPLETQNVVAHIDVQSNVLQYAIGGFGQDYTGGVITFGAYPEQPSPYFRKDNIKHDFDSQWPGMSVESQIYEALKRLVGHLLGTVYVREDGVAFHMSKILIDSGYKRSTIEMFCREAGGIVEPARGIYIGAKNTEMDDQKWEPKPGEARGNKWQRRKTADGAGLAVLFDANHWKTFVWERFSLGMATPSTWRLMSFDTKRQQMFADQVCAEYPTKTAGRGRECLEWQLMPGRNDNEGLDNSVGLAVAANIVGCRLPSADGEVKTPHKKRRRVAFQRRR